MLTWFNPDGRGVVVVSKGSHKFTGRVGGGINCEMTSGIVNKP